MSTKDEVPTADPGGLALFATFVVAAAGLVSMAAGAQVLTVFLVYGATRVVPWVQVALGAGIVAGAVSLSRPRAWPLLPVMLGLGLNVLLGAAWVLYLLMNLAFAALPVVLIPVSMFAMVLLVVTWGAIARAAAVLARGEAETARILAEARENADPSVRAHEARERWTRAGMRAAFALFVSPIFVFLFAATAPDAYAQAEARVFGVLAGRLPGAWATTHADYAYDGSPLEWYVEYESRWIPELPKPAIHAFADGVAEDVAWRLAAATGEGDPADAERALWASGRGREIAAWIADALRRRAVFYRPEALFSRSFDPDLHRVPSTVHLDCDQLVYVFTHVAWRLDLDMRPIPAPMHMYLRYGAPDGGDDLVWVEATQFRTRDDDEPFDADAFFVDASFHPSGRGGSRATPGLVEAAGLYQPYEERDIRDAILGNAIYGLRRAGVEIDDIAEAETRADGSREIILVANLYEAYLRESEAALGGGDAQAAYDWARRASALRVAKGPLVLYTYARERDLAAEAIAAGASGPPLAAEGADSHTAE